MDIEKYRGCSDEQLSSLVQRENHTAYRVLYERFFPILYAHTVKTIPDRDLAKDLIQEVFVRLWRKSMQINIHGKLGPYLYTATKNSIISYYVSSSKIQDYIHVFSLYQNQIMNTPLNNMELKELSDMIEREIDNLPRKMKEIFNLSRKLELSHKEISLLLSISEQTVKKQVGNALKILKKRINYSLLLSLLILSTLDRAAMAKWRKNMWRAISTQPTIKLIEKNGIVRGLEYLII